MALDKPYSTHPVKIAAADGSGTITFKKLGEPTVLPNIKFINRNVSISYTRPTATSPGKRIFGTFGSTDGFCDLELDFPIVYPEDVNTLLGWYMSKPGVVLVSIDGGITNFFAIWRQDDGLIVDGYRHNQREFYKVKINLHLMGKTSTSFDNMEPID